MSPRLRAATENSAMVGKEARGTGATNPVRSGPQCELKRALELLGIGDDFERSLEQDLVHNLEARRLN